ncbi:MULTISPECIES: LEA type 2 family protein [Larkinella]|uniref:Permease n=1 Tax=Larkinella humicola TaxID=2607654 RepID=A0A5N1JID1_9BACT|nr:LEA type 2 family protein [Larkinella humicola]KAA9356195.1 permease [Larkinella humicola]
MKKGGLIALGLLLIGFIGAYIWYQRQQKRAADEPHGTVLTPRLELASFLITDIDDDQLTMNMKLLIDNPLPVGFKAKRVDYEVYIDTALVMKDSYRKTVELEAGDSTLVTLPVKLLYKRFMNVLKQLDQQNADSTVYTIRSTFDLDVPVLGQRTFSVKTEKKLPTLYLPTIKVTAIDFGKISLKQTDLAAKVAIGNRNKFPLNFKDTHYIVSIDGDVVAEGSQPEPILIKEQAVTPVVFPVTLKPGKFDNVALKALFDKKNTNYLIEFRSKMISPDGNSALDDSRIVNRIKGTLADLKELKK